MNVKIPTPSNGGDGKIMPNLVTTAQAANMPPHKIYNSTQVLLANL